MVCAGFNSASNEAEDADKLIYLLPRIVSDEKNIVLVVDINKLPV
jgi:hypothetical protein